ncbi:bifunctional 2',3'-cyclic-nucleotide 2'-phosphodiesterase/3'-nucleotidase [Breznakiella homolactica]|uniref:Bifunctional 2',3'-cyclic-nucleotide 2'-phosphodiesterase/3'-nucleotidase n=1 Tax=Breznakiella homolactica TaxID=2798577 RepID=A0A7T7XNW1_9SPIR|nr:bifunctional 2',3'-cyclic-nucleotide 2'-phosphodiesterase/3'-nucleotidase [Breznakiella homolactica]QQO09789.1 bifunctional 2',3'-cyclic-nucleotide 2'-phosphodiesterase/3'-nucleotidase [Breznakiella homolactica]
MKVVLPKIRWISMVLIIAGALSAYGQTVDITVLATSDVHNNYLEYDYFTDMPTDQNGLVKIATAINQERASNPNVLLLDNGDNIQGNPFGEYLMKNPPQKGQISPIMTLLNAMGYDAMTLGNHEFNFGLPYLNTVIQGAHFPVVCANVVNPLTKTPYFTPYKILVRGFEDRNGYLQLMRIGVIGLVPPQIILWDGAHLRGRVEVMDGYDAAVKYIPQMKAAGADIIIVLAHSGISDFPRQGGEENFGYYMTEIPGVDAVITGHAHGKFPGRAFAGLKGADIDKGTINGIPVVMPSSFADTLGAINLTYEKKNGAWQRTDGSAQLIPVYDTAARTSLYPGDPELAALLEKEHEATVAYIRSPVGGDEGGATAGGSLAAPLNSFFALVRDDYSVQIINEAQTWYTKQALAGTEYANLPVLSAAAPFKAGGRQGPRYYTNVPAGPLAIKNIADLYVFSNTVVCLKMNGAEIKEWLEMSAGQFNQIDPAKQGEQMLVNESFPTYLYDVIDGVTYKIDVSQPARYNAEGTLVDSKAERIKDLRFEGRPIRADQEFVVATNNYRAYGGGNFPGVNPGKIIFASPDENRQVILKYIEYRQEIVPEADGNWELILPAGTGPLIFQSSPLAAESLLPGIRFLRTSETGYGVYQIEQ